MHFQVWDGGAKFECVVCCCLPFGDFELEEAPGGTPQSVEMQRS